MNSSIKKIINIKSAAVACTLISSINSPIAIAEDTVNAGLEEVTVTARRREENLQSVPIAITAFSEQGMKDKGIESAWDLYKAVPSLQVASGDSRNTVNFAMRGQSVSFGTTLTPVNVYFANVPLSTDASASSFFDLANVQVLAGPQGTLFGRNSTGGAVLFTPKKPDDELGGYVKMGVGSDSYQHFEGAANVPLSDSLSMRLAGNIVRHDGYAYDETFGLDLDDQNEKNVRASLLFKPNDFFENYFIFDYNTLDVNGVAYVLRSSESPDPAIQAALAAQQARGIRRVALSSGPDFGPPSETRENYGLTNITEMQFDNVLVRNIFGYRRGESEVISDADGTPIASLGYRAPGVAALGVEGFGGDFPNGSKAITDELQFLGTAFGEKLDWIVGGFYSDSDADVESHFYAAPFLPDGYGSTISKDKSTALFAQGSYDLSSMVEGLSVTAGFRYTWDESEVTTSSVFNVGLPFLICSTFAAPTSITDCHATFDSDTSAPTWTLSADYQMTDDLLVYIAHRHGYRGGGINSTVLPPGLDPAEFQLFDPETVDDYEIGIKKDWSAGDVYGRINMALYHSKYEDIQRNRDVPGVVGGLVANAAKAEINGFELQATLVAYKKLDISVTYAYTDASYSKYTDPLTGADFSANEFQLTPENKLSFTARYDVDLGSNGVLSPSFTYTYQDDMYYTEQSTLYPDLVIDSYGILDARVDWSKAFGTSLTVSLIGRNLTDEDYILNGNGNFSMDRVFYGDPRTVVLEFSYPFSGQ